MKGSGFCGINCNQCPIYKATVGDDPKERVKLAQQWNSNHATNYKVSQMVCLGCKSDRHFVFCDECEIRECNIRRGLKNCAGCPEFPCDIGREFWKTMPEEFENLKKIRKLIFKDSTESNPEYDVSEEDEEVRGISKKGVLSYQEQTEKNHQEHAIDRKSVV